MKVSYLVSNSLQVALCGAIAAEAGRAGASTHWIALDGGAASIEPGHSWWSPNDGVLVDRLLGPRTWRTRRAALAELVRTIDGQLEEHRPDVLACPNDRPFAEQVVIRRAIAHSVPTVLLQDGLIATWAQLGWGERGLRLGQHALRGVGVRGVGGGRPGMGTTDYAGLIGEHWRRIVRTRSGDPDTVQVIGQPLFDATVRASLERPHDGGGDRLRVAWLASDLRTALGDHRGQREQLADVALLHDSLADALGERFELVVRPHPLEAAELLDGFERLGVGIRSPEDHSLANVIIGSDVVVSNISSAILAAIAAGRSSLLFAIHLRHPRYRRLMAQIPCPAVTRPQELRPHIEELGDPARRAARAARQREAVRAFLRADPSRSSAHLGCELLERAAERGPAPGASRRTRSLRAGGVPGRARASAITQRSPRPDPR